VALALALGACTGYQKPTRHCASVIARRPEASLAYTGATVFERGGHEGNGTSEASDPAVPWAAQRLGVGASESALFAWYANWLGSHGWTHTRDQRLTDSSGRHDGDLSSWQRGDESFEVGVDLAASTRSQYPLAPDQMLVTTEYLAPASVLGCQ
jgi:hypothetical protein